MRASVSNPRYVSGDLKCPKGERFVEERSPRLLTEQKSGRTSSLEVEAGNFKRSLPLVGMRPFITPSERASIVPFL